MKNKLSFFLVLIVMFSLIGFVSSQGCSDEGWKGYSKIHENKTITITCPTCDYINFSSTNTDQEVFLDNVEMDKSGSIFYYTFSGEDLNKVGTYQIDGYSNLDTPIGLCFDVTMTGNKNSLGIYTYLISILILLFLFLIWINLKFNSERRNSLYKKIVVGYCDSKNNDNKNLGNVILYTIGYGLLNNIIVFYYLIILSFLFLLTEMVESYGISSLVLLLSTILNISLYCFIIVFIYFIFSMYSLVIRLLKDVGDGYMGVFK